MGKEIRLDKYLAEMGRGSRSQIKEAAKKGRIQVNGMTEKKTERKICPGRDRVVFDGREVAYLEYEYYLLNKPQGVVSATDDNRHRTVVDLVRREADCRADLFPVGRLDIDTEGLLILTNDGDLAHRLLSPKKHVDKVYYARISGMLPSDAAARMAAGMTLEDGTPVLPAKLEVLTQKKQDPEIRLTIREGKFHQVKRMFEALGCQVVYLKRLSMGGLWLDERLKPGQCRRLTSEELQLLQEAPGGGTMKGGKQQEAIVPGIAKAAACGGAEGSGLLPKIAAKKAILFDLDGTLVDSMWMWHEIDVEYLGRFGYDCPPELQKVIEGMSFTETAVYFKERFRIPDSLEQIKQAWIDMSIEKYRMEVPLKKGARRFLEYLRQSGIRAGIATSNGRDMVDAVLEALEITSFFQVIITACEVAAGKPAPDIYLKVAADLGAKPEECMVFEDVPAGIQAGKAAGMEVCAVEDAFSLHMKEEKRQLADYYIEDYEELFDEAEHDA